MKYALKSGAASFEGEPTGEKEFVYPVTKGDTKEALKEALEDLAIKTQAIKDLTEELECFISGNYCECGHPACSKERDNKSAEGLISNIKRMITEQTL